MRQIIVINEIFDDIPESLTLGAIFAPQKMNEFEIRRKIEEAWEEFITTEPDSDSQFINFLEERGWERANEPLVIEVNG